MSVTRPIKTSEKEEKKSSWFAYKPNGREQLLIEKHFFKKGIFIVKPNTFGTKDSRLTTRSSFSLNTRQLHVFDAQCKDSTASAPNFKKQKSILDALTGFLPQTNPKSPVITEKHDVIIFNKERRDEVFLPLAISDSDEGTTAQFVCPWLSENKGEFVFSGFDQFVTAGCLPGIKGMDQNGGTFPLIKHDIKLFATQKIEHIILESDSPNPYEEILFIELENLATLIEKYSTPDKQKRLLYHLPYYDYMLFGVELFIRGRITLEALNDLFMHILNKKDEHERRIRSICALHHVTVSIQSPFENIFGDINDKIDSDSDLATQILGVLNISSEELDPSRIKEREQKQNEKNLVKKCIQYLTTNTYNEAQRQVWTELSIHNEAEHSKKLTELCGKLSLSHQDALDLHAALTQGLYNGLEDKDLYIYAMESINLKNKEELTAKSFDSVRQLFYLLESYDVYNLENLFNVANASMIGLAAKDKEDYKTCSLLPLSEKQIQVGYQKYAKQHQKSHSDTKSSPAVVFLTYLDPVITYGPGTNGLSFYFGQCQQILSDLILAKSLLQSVYKNIGMFATSNSKSKITKLRDALEPGPMNVKPDDRSGFTPPGR